MKNTLSAEQRVEAYLDQVLAPLVRKLSAFHCEELRRELRVHLWGRVEAYRELGSSEAEAVTEALKQFGGTKHFIRQWRREWSQAAQHTAKGGLWPATLAGLRLSAVALLLACTPVIVWAAQAPLYGHAIPWLRGWLENNAAWFGPLIGWTDFAILPALLGIAIGRCSPQRAGSGAFLALTSEIAAGATLDGVGLKLWPHLSAISDVLGQAALLEFAWLPITCVFASLTGWGIQRRRRAVA